MFEVVKMTVVPEGGQVIPGGRLVLALTLQNASAIVDRYHVAVTGVPDDWVTLDKTSVSLFPGASERVMVTIAPPAGVTTAAGDYPITIVTTSEDDPTIQTRHAVALVVGSVGQLGMDLLPPDTEGRQGTYRVTFTNGSNRDATVALRVRDSEEGLLYTLEPEEPVQVPAGGERVVRVGVRPKVRETIGEPHPYDIEFKGAVQGGDESDPLAAALAALLTRQGRYTYHPRFSALTMPRWLRRLPMWALILLLLLLLLLLSLAGNAAASAIGTPAVTPQPRPKVTPSVSAAGATKPAAVSTRAARAPATLPAHATVAPKATTPNPSPNSSAGGLAPQIGRFAVQVGRDGSLALSWAVAHAKTVLIDGRPVDAQGLRALHLTRATTLVITAMGPGGAVTQVLQIVPSSGTPRVLPAVQTTRFLPTIQQFTAGTDSASGGLALTWTVAGATRVTLNGVPVSSSGARRITLGEGTTYELRATNSLGTVVETVALPRATPRSTVTRIVLHPPTIPRFALVHDNSTDTYKLVWNTSGATAVTLNGQTVASSGSFTPALPLQTGSYQLVATNRDGSATAQVSVVVQAATPSTRLYTITGPRIVVFALRRINGKLYVVWQVGDASRVVLNGKVVPASGQMQVPEGTKLSSIRLTATNDAGNAQRELALPPPPIPAAATAAPTATPSATGTPVPPATATNTAVPTATRTARPARIAPAAPSATSTSQPTTTSTAVPTATATSRPTATRTPVPPLTPTDIARPTSTHTPQPTATHTPRPTATHTPRPTATRAPAHALVMPTETATATRTAVPATPTATQTVVPPAPLGSFGASPASVAFGNVLVGSSAARVVTVTNGGPGNLSITGVAVAGPNAGDFTMTSNGCAGLALAPGASCTVALSFVPAMTGARAATLTVADNGPGGPHAVALGGTGVTRELTFSTTSLAFGTQRLGTASGARAVTLSNTGTDAVTIDSITIDGGSGGDYLATSTCGATLASGASCTIGVTFAPTAIGARTANLVVTDNAGGSPHSVALSGNGINPIVSLSPGSLAFGDQQLGATSASRSVTLTNNGTTPLTIGSIVVTGAAAGDYAATSMCGATVAPGATCTITVTFTPGAILGRNAAVTITDNAGASPQSVPLSGNGINPVVGLTPGTLTFPDQPLGTTSAPRTVTLTNNGTTPLTISGIDVVGINPGDAPGDFTQSNTCGASLAPGASCAITIGFAPTAINGRTASVRITDNAAGGTQFIPLAGNGINPIPAFGPASLDFGQVYIPDLELGTRTVTRTVTLTNTGTTPLTIGSITVAGAQSGDFTPSSTCGASLAPGAACTISVAFSPGAILGRNAAIVVTDNAAAGGGTQTVPLHGFGINPQGLPTPGNVDFGTVVLGQSSTLPVTLTNTGTTSLNISNVTIHGFSAMTAAARRPQAVAAPASFDDFSANTSACPAAVAPGASCIIAVTFRPTHTDPSGPRADLLEIDDNTLFNGGQQLVELTGQGLNQPPAFSPPSLQFGDVPTGVTNTQFVTVTNPGTADLHITTIYVDGPAASDFGLSGGSGSSLPACSTSTPLGPGASCVIGVSFTPTITGTRTATLHLSDDAAGSPQGVPLSGSGTDSRALYPPTLSFDNPAVAVSDTVTRTITVSSTGTTPLIVTAVTLNDPNALGYAESDDCRNQAIPVGQACTITVTLTPVTTTNGISDTTASLHIIDNSRYSPEQPITLSATTGRPVTSLSSNRLTFPNTVAGTSSATQTVTLVNNSVSRCNETSTGVFCSPSYELLLPAGAVTLGGPNASDFTINSDGCSAPAGSAYRRVDPVGFFYYVNGNDSCNVTVSFTPQPGATGTVSATLTYNDNASNAPQVVTLYGTVATRIRIRPSIVDTFYPCGYQGDYSVTPCETRAVTVTNTGPTTLTVTDITDQGGNFTVDSSGCTSAAIPVGGTCAINVTLNSQAVYANGQPISGTDSLIITSNGIDTNGHDSPQLVPLEWSNITVSPHGLDFGDVPIGTGSVTQTITVNNAYDAPGNYNGVTIISATIVGTSPDDNPEDFAIVPGGDGCSGQIVQADGNQPSSCQITVVFTPTAGGPRRADLLISDTGTPLPHDVTLDGVGTNVAASVSPSSLSFPDTISGTVSTSVVTVTNNSSGSGDNSLVVYGASISGPNAGDFTADASACQGMAFGPGASCQVTVSFRPTAGGARNATLVISDNTSPQQVPLSGNGTVPQATPTPSPLDLGTVAVSDTVTRTVTMSSTGTGNLQVYSATISGPNAGDFTADASACQGVAFQPGASCPINVALTPTDVMTRSATLLVYDNAPDSPQAVPLVGQGTRPYASFDSGAATFGPTFPGQTSATQPFTLTNYGQFSGGPVTLVIPLNAASISGAGAGAFHLDSDGCSGQKIVGQYSGANCIVGVSFHPPLGSSVTITATLAITDNAVDAPQTVTLQGFVVGGSG